LPISEAWTPADYVATSQCACATIPELLNPLSEPDPKTTLRELHEYFAGSYEPQNKLAPALA
jgi:hypothetical protein